MHFIYLLQFSYFFFAVVSEQGNVIFIKELQVKKTVTVYLRTQPVCSTVSLIWNTKLPKLKEICKYHIDTCVYKIISVPILIPWFLWFHTCQRWSRLHYIYQGNGADLCTQLHLCGQNCQARVVLGQQHYAQSHSWGCQDCSWCCVPVLHSRDPPTSQAAPSLPALSPKYWQRKGPYRWDWQVPVTEACDGLAASVEIRPPSVLYTWPQPWLHQK